MTEPQVLLAIVGVYSIFLTLCYRNGSTKTYKLILVRTPAYEPEQTHCYGGLLPLPCRRF